MKPFKRILVYADSRIDKTDAIDLGLRLSRETGASLKLIDVVEPPPAWHLGFAPASILPAKLKQFKEKRLQNLARAAGAEKIVKAAVLEGTPYLEIVREVLRGPYDLLIMAGVKEEGFGPFGSTGIQVMRKCPCPVWLVKPSRPRKESRILAAIDPGHGERDQEHVAQKVIEAAQWLAGLEGNQLHVVHAWHLFGEGYLHGHAGVPAAELKEYESKALAEARKNLDAFLSKYHVEQSGGRVHLITGDPAVVIPGLAQELRIHLVIMGTLARSGMSGILIGNTAERIVNRIDCSLLAVKPDAFVCPVSAED